jgi:hypothetical protein
MDACLGGSATYSLGQMLLHNSCHQRFIASGSFLGQEKQGSKGNVACGLLLIYIEGISTFVQAVTILYCVLFASCLRQ